MGARGIRRWIGRRETEGLKVLNQGVQMGSHKNKKPGVMGGQGTWGAPSTSASNPAIILLVLEECFTECFTSGLTDGEPAGLPTGVTGSQPAYRWGSQRGGKKKPRQQGVLSGLWGTPVGTVWVYPGGLTIPLYCPDSISSILP